MRKRFRQWEHGDPEKMRARIEDYVPHQPILPEFPKKRITTAVYKLCTVCGDVAFMVDEWSDEFLRIREKLDAKVIHLMRHPARWAASIARWTSRPLRQCLQVYSEGNLAFLARCAGKPWYKAVKHEDATRMPRAVFADVFRFCNIVYGEEWARFLWKMHSKDHDTNPDRHSTIMTKDTVMRRWRDLDADDLLLANEMVTEYWSGIYERVLRS
jgi:hypothetical protein